MHPVALAQSADRGRDGLLKDAAPAIRLDHLPGLEELCVRAVSRAQARRVSREGDRNEDIAFETNGLVNMMS